MIMKVRVRKKEKPAVPDIPALIGRVSALCMELSSPDVHYILSVYYGIPWFNVQVLYPAADEKATARVTTIREGRLTADDLNDAIDKLERLTGWVKEDV